MVRANNAWVRLRNHIEPAVAEARARKEALSRKRRANQHLFDREERQDICHIVLAAAIVWFVGEQSLVEPALPGDECLSS